MVKQPGWAEVSRSGGFSANANADGVIDAYKHKPRQPPAVAVPRRGAAGAGLSGPRRRAIIAHWCANHAQLDGKKGRMLAESPIRLDSGG
jgi:hypothetical protein